MAQQPLVGQGLLIIEASLWHSVRLETIGRSPLDERSARRRYLSLTKHNSHKRQASMPRRDSNPQAQQASGHRPTPQTARPLGSAHDANTVVYKSIVEQILRTIERKARLSSELFINYELLAKPQFKIICSISVNREDNWFIVDHWVANVTNYCN
jgi:hypothetical protein